VVGAVFYDVAVLNDNRGKAYLYYGSATGVPLTANVNFVSNNNNQELFGYSVASAGDVNGDGYSDLLIASEFFNDGANTNEGRVFVYNGAATGVSPTASYVLDDADQSSAAFGRSVASAGDVNGDGYSDVIVGAFQYNASFTDDGAAFIYHGSATGLATSPNVILTGSNQLNSRFGQSVASAGDVNGDGYSDVIIGAHWYDDGANSDEGRAYIYYGSPTGVPNTVAQTLDDGNQAGGQFGFCVAGAGDVNGDGYSDVVIGAHLYTIGGFTQCGRAFVHQGNDGGGKRNNIRLYNTDLVTPIQQNNVAAPNLFGAGLFAKSPLGRQKGKMVWEVKKQGQSFSGNPITNSTAYLDKQSSFTDLGIGGVELKNQLQKNTLQNKLRIRVEYSKATAITGQVYGPWRYPADYLRGAHGMNSTPLPLELISFTAQWISTDHASLQWITTKETNVEKFILEKSTDGSSFTAIGTKAANNSLLRNEYNFIDANAIHTIQYYRLTIVAQNGRVSYSKIVQVNKTNGNTITIYPNPVLRSSAISVTINSTSNSKATWQLYNSTGQLVHTGKMDVQKGTNPVSIATTDLAKGVYNFSIQWNKQVISKQVVVQ
jgi:Secretion system C-terminal sorting domain/FG-GAP repeat